ncbi:DUF294 nucleotidyltransferase-like domain-containing protein [Nitrincola sp. A-D6]|uniref:DUF294 nucleotidyltransferase-like domain-containing protein n=1 Tax=Nitrincola sp. A-D6 TaxID=1545442 RepID=UPI001F438AFE|nr:DUF294 nucleotidyltransferase-like domain-containing protein [Nitrincola sp. A-D6]
MTETGWRSLFSLDGLPNTKNWPDCLESLKQAFACVDEQRSMAEMKAWQPVLVKAMQVLNLPAWSISQVISDHNDWIYRYTLRESLAEMQRQGWGDPPCNFCVLTLGSGARHESLLGPDQDNAMIIDNYPDTRHNEIDTWFQTLGERFTDKLDIAGIPLCRGHVMARWPLWRKSLDQWRDQMHLWSRRRTVKLVQLSNILLDFYPVYGQTALADKFRQTILELMPGAGLFLDEMNELQKETTVALDRFDRLSSDGQDAPHQQAINLKRQGLLPMQAALRLMALRNGVVAQDCKGRLTELSETGHLSADRAIALNDALEYLLSLLLDAQMEAVSLGRKPDGWVDKSRLAPHHRQQLKMALIQIRELQKLAAG